MGQPNPAGDRILKPCMSPIMFMFNTATTSPSHSCPRLRTKLPHELGHSYVNGTLRLQPEHPVASVQGPLEQSALWNFPRCKSD